MLKEFDRFQVLVLAVLIGDPLSVFLSVIQIKHVCNGIYPESVNMEFLAPEDRIGDQEILDLALAVIKDLGTPVRMLTLLGIGIFI